LEVEIKLQRFNNIIKNTLLTEECFFCLGNLFSILRVFIFIENKYLFKGKLTHFIRF
jgi:hypothetical protein